MSGFLVRLLITALGLWVAQAIVPGVEIRDVGTLFLAALLLGIVNAVVRPLIVILTLPITVLSLGLFLLVVTAAMVAVVAALLGGLEPADGDAEETDRLTRRRAREQGAAGGGDGAAVVGRLGEGERARHERVPAAAEGARELELQRDTAAAHSIASQTTRHGLGV